MNDLEFLNYFVQKTKPKSPLRYALREEGRIMMELDRAEELASTAHERKRDEIEANKIKEALLKEKHDAFVTQKRYQQLLRNTDELRRLQRYISSAEMAKDLWAQLKLQERKIEKRFADADQLALDVRARYRAAEERQRQLEYEKRLEQQCLRNDLIAQMKANSLRRADEVDDRIKHGQEIRERVEKLDEEDRIKAEAAAKAKIVLRKEILTTLGEREEIRKIQNKKDMTTLQYQYREQDRLNALQQHIKHCRHWGIQRKACVSGMIGEKTHQIEKAKRDAVTSLIDVFVNERKVKDDQECERKIEEANENRRMLHQEVLSHLERKEAEKQRQKEITMEIALKRKPLAREEQDRPRGKIRSQKAILEVQEFMAEKLAIDKERFKKEAAERQAILDSLAKQDVVRQNEIEAAKNEILQKKSIEFLRYLPTPVLRADYIPEPLRSKVHEQVRKDPIPMLTKKRHQPHLRGHHSDSPQQVRCSKTCKNPNFLSNVFPM